MQRGKGRAKEMGLDEMQCLVAFAVWSGLLVHSPVVFEEALGVSSNTNEREGL